MSSQNFYEDLEITAEANTEQIA